MKMKTQDFLYSLTVPLRVITLLPSSKVQSLLWQSTLAQLQPFDPLEPREALQDGPK